MKGTAPALLYALAKGELPALLGKIKSFSFKHRAKRGEINNFTIVRKLILGKERPFTGGGASDASGRSFSAS